MSALFTLALALPAGAGIIPAGALPIPNRFAQAEIVVVGKVTSIEDKGVEIGKTPYKIAVVTVSDAVLAPRKTMTIRVGFRVIPPNVAINPRPFQAAVGQEGIYFLKKQPDTDFYMPVLLGFIGSGSANFDKELAEVKRCAKLLEDPNASLKSKKADEGFVTAAMLLARYRSRIGQNAKTEPIEAEQSKLILKALAGADWNAPRDFSKLQPTTVLGRLGLTKKDGWDPPSFKDAKAYAATPSNGCANMPTPIASNALSRRSERGYDGERGA